MSASGQPPGAPTSRGNRKEYWIGVALGMIPVVLAWIALGVGLRDTSSPVTAPLAILAGILYLAALVAAIVLIIRLYHRSIGTGLLTMVFIGPVVWSVGCIVILTSGHG